MRRKHPRTISDADSAHEEVESTPAVQTSESDAPPFMIRIPKSDVYPSKTGNTLTTFAKNIKSFGRFDDAFISAIWNQLSSRDDLSLFSESIDLSANLSQGFTNGLNLTGDGKPIVPKMVIQDRDLLEPLSSVAPGGLSLPKKQNGLLRVGKEEDEKHVFKAPQPIRASESGLDHLAMRKRHLDIIVRHPDYGALVDSEVEIEAVNSRSWMSIIRMYVHQVKLAYLSPALNSPTGVQAVLHLAEPTGANALSTTSANNQFKLSEPNQIPLNAHLPSLRNNRASGPTSADVLNSPTWHQGSKLFRKWL
ncbi:hypothetical protein PCASD_00934 [Puccinia coronata f. sp. avenae]|uniref:Uncharacterized protein n=1 Tax=Puccinia coronata f. sp. avenae TaxID=200324 RepID=A0A2N5VPG1_9BASI|nr:hypothetical protein PCASD_00934 [Puccinia coronata f. sp. avenae]